MRHSANTLFDNFIADHCLYWPTTTAFYHANTTEPIATFHCTHAGTWHTNDYIAATYDIYVHPTTVRTEPAIARVADHVDHIPITCRVTIANTAPDHALAPPVPYDPNTFYDPVKRSHFQRLLTAAPIIPYHVEPTAHHAIINNYIVDALAVAFPKVPGRKHKKFITDHTFDHIKKHNLTKV